MANKNTRKDRFTAQSDDFEIVKPAPGKKTGNTNTGKAKPTDKKPVKRGK